MQILIVHFKSYCAKLPVHRPAGVEENFEADYLYELESKSTIASDMKELVDYAANFMGAFSSWWSPGSAAERQFGDSGNKKFMAREERRSMTSKIDTHGEFDSRSLQAMPVKEVAYADRADATRPTSAFSARRANRRSSS